MKATRAFYDRGEFPDGAVVEMTIWKVPGPVLGCVHAFKYSLFYGYPGERVVGYENERGKGDHRHYGNEESDYVFSDPDQLTRDFGADIARWNHEHGRA